MAVFPWLCFSDLNVVLFFLSRSYGDIGINLIELTPYSLNTMVLKTYEEFHFQHSFYSQKYFMLGGCGIPQKSSKHTHLTF